MIKIQANYDKTAMAKAAEMFPKAGARALNEAAKQTRTFANKRLREVYNIRQAALNKEIKIIPANQRRLQARLVLRDKPIGIIKFFPKKTSAGVGFQIRVGQQRVIRSGFIAKMESGHIGVFVRTGKKQTAKSGRYRGKLRETIEERFTISSAEMFGSQRMYDEVSQFIADNLPRILESKLKEK
ncbi:MAG: hypothetical protein ACYC09_14830 [Bacteroidota bacterium]